jgi:hypothetical protein
MFIGVRERGEADIEFRVAPSGTATLPEDLMTHYRKYEGALLRADINGASSASDPAMRRDEDYFRTFAAAHTVRLRAELHSGSDAEQRAAAAMVTGYSASKKSAMDDLLFALQDPDEGVRTQALRALAAIAPGVPIPPAALVDLLNSVVLSDRMESTKALLVLSEKPNAVALDLIRAHALPSLVEMARWQTRSYAQPPFRLLGRVAGLKDGEVNERWEKDDRDPVIQKAMDSAPPKPGLQ